MLLDDDRLRMLVENIVAIDLKNENEDALLKDAVDPDEFLGILNSAADL